MAEEKVVKRPAGKKRLDRYLYQARLQVASR